MVSSSRMEVGTQILSARVRKTIQSIKEIVGNHSDADIYVALKETNMDPNETAQKLLNQGGDGDFDTFHEVKRRRDRKKEPQSVGYKDSAEQGRHSDNVGQGMKFRAPSERNAQRMSYSRSTLPGISREFRVVRDNRANHLDKEVKPPSLQYSTSANEQLILNISEKGSSATSGNPRSSGVRNSSHVLNNPSESHPRYSGDAISNAIDRKGTSEEKQHVTSNAAEQLQPVQPNNVQQNSATAVASASSDVGVYSSSTDPVHVPSPDSRSSGGVGAIRREVGVVGIRRRSSDNLLKQSSVPSSSYSNSLVGKDGTSTNSFQSFNTISKTEQFSQTNVTEPSFPGMPASRPFLNNQYNNRQHQQLVGHQRVSQQNKEWKPKSSQKPNSNSLGVIGAPKKPASPAQKSKDIESDTAKIQDKLSQLTFGTIGTEVDSSRLQSNCQSIGTTDKSNEESAARSVDLGFHVSTDIRVSNDDASGSTKVELQQDDHTRSNGSDSPPSGTAAEQRLPDNKESSRPQNLNNYADIGLVQDNSISYVSSEAQQPQDSHDMPGFSAYDPPTGYDIPYFRPTMDETGYSSHTANPISASTVPMVQQQQQQHQVAQMYPQVHVSHFSNLMPFRQFLSPVYVPPMPMPAGYSGNPPYPHPSNGSSYVLMHGGSSHLNANGIKYGVQQFKPVPSGNPTGFGNFTNPTGYAMSAHGMAGSATSLEDSSRIKYKDNLYVPNPQADTSEIWIQNPRELPGMQPAQYYNLSGQTPHHAAYMPSHAGHASFNAAAAQSSHMQYPGMYHASPQPAAMANPHHHLGAAMGNNVGVGVGVAAAAPGAQVGAYQQPQLGHLNWTTNFQ
ncbi:GBF-interacting protein 1-like isoform X1 [Senna tora]|uniref:GBF-interacting protein 1-like isoform X1 n=1 Tax=Senna tora TaxID=362788 RepID=A0A834XFM7_9FABA|nr:GBF-interacting protein 1-like isoform X1 [Senna tora]